MNRRYKVSEMILPDKTRRILLECQERGVKLLDDSGMLAGVDATSVMLIGLADIVADLRSGGPLLVP